MIIDAVCSVDDIVKSFKQIGLFTGVCSVMLVFYGVIILPTVILVLTRKNPLKLFAVFFEPVLLACEIFSFILKFF